MTEALIAIGDRYQAMATWERKEAHDLVRHLNEGEIMVSVGGKEEVELDHRGAHKAIEKLYREATAN